MSGFGKALARGVDAAAAQAKAALVPLGAAGGVAKSVALAKPSTKASMLGDIQAAKSAANAAASKVQVAMGLMDGLFSSGKPAVSPCASCDAAAKVAAADAEKAAPPPVALLEVGTYGTLAPRSLGDGMTPDHIPSLAAIVASIESKTGEELTKTEVDALRRATATVMIKTGMHQQISRTYGGRNSAQVIAQDATDLKAAALKDMAIYRPVLLAQGKSAEEIDSAFSAIHAANKALGLY